MSDRTRYVDHTLPVQTLAPQDITGGAATGSYLSLANADNAAVIISVGAVASGADDMTVQVNQATDTSGTGAKILPIVDAWTCAAGGKTAETVSSNTITITASDDNKTYVIPIRAQYLDNDNDFIAIAPTITSPGANSVLISATVEFGGERNGTIA
jgi:hypothetical protein